MVSIENYKCFCKDGALERFESKKGRGFVKCSKELCSLFVPEEKYLDLMHAYENKVLEKYKLTNFPMCDCNESASLWLSYSSNNPNGPISGVRTLTLKKSVAFSCGLIACRNRRRENEKRVVRRRESHQKEVKENETMAQDVKLSLPVTKTNRNNVQIYTVKNILKNMNGKGQ